MADENNNHRPQAQSVQDIINTLQAVICICVQRMGGEIEITREELTNIHGELRQATTDTGGMHLQYVNIEPTTGH